MARIIRPYDLLLNAETGWQAQVTENIALEAGPIRLRTLESLLPPITDPLGSFGGHTLPLGVAVWSEQREIFISDPVGRAVLRWQPCCGEPKIALSGPRPAPAPPAPTLAEDECPPPMVPAPPPRPGQLVRPAGIANRGDSLALVDAGAGWILIYTLPGLALSQVIGPFSTGEPPQPWRPVDVAAGPRGAWYAADANGRVWRLDRQGRPDPQYEGRLPEGYVPVRIQVDAQGIAYVVGQAGQPIVLFDRYGRAMPQPSELRTAVDNWVCQHFPAVTNDRCPSNPADELAGRRQRPATYDEETEARAHLLPEELSALITRDLTRWMDAESARTGLSREQLWVERRLELYEHNPPNIIAAAYETHLGAWIQSQLPESPLELVEGTGGRAIVRLALPCPIPPVLTDLAVDSSGNLEGTGLHLLHRPSAARFQTSGLFLTKALDSRRAGNPWHRVVLELSIPERTGVRLFSLTSDVPLPGVDASGLLAEPPSTGPWQAAAVNIDEWLVQSPPGRYLHLALTLKGPGDRTPEVRGLYIYAQRNSSMRFLPATFQEDEVSRDLLDRLMALFDTLYGEIEDQIEQFPALINIASAPPAFLPWLASWFDLTLEASWTDAQKRTFLREAVNLYAWRSTPRGLRRLLELHTGSQQVRVIEHFRGLAAAGDEDSPLAGWLGTVSDPAHHFTVLLPARAMDTPEKRAAIKRLIDANKPAHTHYTLRPSYEGVWLAGANTRGSALGIDIRLRSRRDWTLPGLQEEEPEALPELNMTLPDSPKRAGRLGSARLNRARLSGRRMP